MAAGEGVAVYDLVTALLEYVAVIAEAALLNDLEFDDSGSQASGIYFSALQFGKYNVGSKMLLIK